MERSAELEKLFQELLIGVQTNDLTALEETLSRAEGSMLIGTDPAEYTRDIEGMLKIIRASAPAQSQSTFSVDDARSYVEGSVGWIDRKKDSRYDDLRLGQCFGMTPRRARAALALAARVRALSSAVARATSSPQRTPHENAPATHLTPCGSRRLSRVPRGRTRGSPRALELPPGIPFAHERAQARAAHPDRTGSTNPSPTCGPARSADPKPHGRLGQCSGMTPEPGQTCGMVGSVRALVAC